VCVLDGKLVELAVWAPVAECLAGPNGEEALALLRHVREEMDARYRELLARSQRKVRREDGLPLHLVVCDELAFYLTLPEKRQRQEFAELLRDLVARGRAAGVIVIAATQKPGAETVPTALRDLFGFRFALRCNTPQAPTRSSDRAGHRPARMPPRSRAGSVASATCSPRASGRCA
jgi:S-DNA-T family DNA segregation ATPase FtsK/SpoIIIE